MSQGNFEYSGLEVAVIGMSGKFPGARNIDEFWQNLLAAKETIRFFSDQELAEEGVPAALLANPHYVKANGVLEHPYLFDNALFGYHDREAALMDPQIRLLHEAVWDVLENAGYAHDKLDHVVGMFAGATDNLLWLRNIFEQHGGDAAALFEASSLSKRDYLTTRIAYNFNLNGPAVNVQTACSTSLVAVHLAVQSLLNGDCDMAIAGGASVQAKKEGYLYQPGMISSPDGHCRPFDAQARGTVGGEGVGLVLLKRLSDAEQDGDNILAVIKGTAINNDGAHKVGFTAPSVQGQSAVIQAALRAAEVDPATIGYIECHGTATQLGDPVEVEALGCVFGGLPAQSISLGALKANIGHLDAAAGIAGLIKTVLCLQEQTLPATLHYREANPNIDFARTPFQVNDRLRAWPSGGHPLRAGVSSFGIGGTNAHVVLEQYQQRRETDRGRDVQLLPLSANTESALRQRGADLQAAWQVTDAALADVSFTLQTGRAALAYRSVAVVAPGQAPDAVLAGIHGGQLLAGRAQPDAACVFMFPGQGSQFPGMARAVYHGEATFRRYFDAACGALPAALAAEIRALLLAPAADAHSAQRIASTEITQPALFVFEYALAKLLNEWGIHPAAMIGHSVGEYVAACLANVFSLDDAVKLVVARGQVMAKAPAGAMLSVNMAAAELARLIREPVAIAASNSSQLCVAAGPHGAIDELAQVLSQQGVKHGRLHTSHAFHSSLMHPVVDEFRAQFEGIGLHPPQQRYLSNVTGGWIDAAQATSVDYWCRHLTGAVAFEQGLAELLRQRPYLFVEVGPGHSLCSFVRGHAAKSANTFATHTVPHAKEQDHCERTLQTALASLFVHGIGIDWHAYRSGEQRQRVALPGYPFEGRLFAPGRRAPGPAAAAPAGPPAVPAHARPALLTPYCAPQTALQEQVCAIWQTVFQIDRVGIHDNFYELGGQSLMAIRLMGLLEAELNIKLDAKQIFSHNTVSALSAYIAQAQSLAQPLADEYEEVEV